ncbi:MAG TPA: hypothetical protein VFA22_04700 [Stellaceae bacterium]|nr:hypothetical protein [Stellaceae bacterium]
MSADVARNDLKACLGKVRLGTRLIALGLLVLLVQGAFWLDQGYWSAFDIASIARWLGVRIPDFPGLEWSGMQAVIDWVVAFPLSALPIGIGFSLAWSGAARADLSQLPDDRAGG